MHKSNRGYTKQEKEEEKTSKQNKITCDHLKCNVLDEKRIPHDKLIKMKRSEIKTNKV